MEKDFRVWLDEKREEYKRQIYESMKENNAEAVVYFYEKMIACDSTISMIEQYQKEARDEYSNADR